MRLRDGVEGFITVHPSFLLRLPDAASREREYARFVADLRLVAQHLPEIRRRGSLDRPLDRRQDWAALRCARPADHRRYGVARFSWETLASCPVW